MSQLTEELTIGDKTYTLKTALGWYEMQTIEQSQFRLFADGKAVSQADDIADIPLLEIRPDTADAMLKRLSLWLVDYKPIEVKKINPAHVPVLLARIEELEAAQAAEVKALADAHPLMIRKREKSLKPAPALPVSERSLKE